MNTRSVTLATAIWFTVSAAGWAIDTVKTTDSKNILGQVAKMSALEVTVKTGSVEKPVPVNQIEVIYYESEPALLKGARIAAAAGRYEDGLSSLEKIDPTSVSRAEIKQDIEFYKALCAAQMALAGNGDVKQAGRQMAAFATGNSGNYHYLKACEIVGDLLVADRNYSSAQSYYGQLAKAPWGDLKMRAGVAIGRAQLAGGKATEALKSFDAVLDNSAQGAAADRQRLAATLGKARCMAAANQSDQAIKLIEGVIDKADPEESQLHAQAYNALGTAYRKAGRTKDALLAFLQVDVLYFSSPADHVEALENLSVLWNQVQKPQRAAEAVRTLRDRYKVNAGSP